MNKKNSVAVNCFGGHGTSYHEDLVGLSIKEALRKFSMYPYDPHMVFRLNGKDADIDEVLKPGDRFVFTMRFLKEYNREVVWKLRNRPSQKTLKRVLEEYVGQGSRVFFNADKKCFLCSLPGDSSSYPYRDLKGETQKKNRQFSVYWKKSGIRIEACWPDRFTSDVAEGFARLCSEFWTAF